MVAAAFAAYVGTTQHEGHSGSVQASAPGSARPGDADTTAVAELGSPSRYAPIRPTRVIDTRTDPFRRRLPTNGSLSMAPVTPAVSNASGVAAGSVSAVVVNITIVDPAAAGFVTVWPTGSAQPTVSSLNADFPGQNVANLVTVPLGADGFISLFSSSSADFIVDVQGVYVSAASSATGRFVPVDQRRAIDTRRGSTLGVGGSLSVDLRPFGVPGSASAAVLNVTATNTGAAGYFSIWPATTPMPTASNLNASGPGQTVANQVMSQVTGGVVSVFSESGGDVIVDVAGYFTGSADAESASGLYVALPPARLLDTRSVGPFSSGRPIDSNATLTLPIAGRSGVPEAGSVLAMALNLTATRTQDSGYVTGWPANTPLPATSTLNFMAAGRTVANHAITALNGGAASYFSFGGNDLLVDLLGYWTTGAPPPAPGPAPITINTAIPPVTTTAPPAPPSFGPHAFLYDFQDGTGRYGRWNPCAPIVYVVNADRADQAMVDQMNLAIAEVENATGLDFVYGGPTSAGLDFDVPQGADAIFGFSDQFATPVLAGGTIGVGGGSFSTTSGRVESGFALADVDGIVSLEKLRATFMHEIAHMVGLDHVGDSSQLMYAFATAVNTFRNGDLEGLWRVGAAQGCLAGDEAPADGAPWSDAGSDPILVVRT